MDYRKIIAIIPSLTLDNVEEKLKQAGVPGMSVSKVHGYGEYRNFYTKDTMTDCSRVEVYTEKNKVKQIVDAIAKAAYQGLESDGVISVIPVEDFLHIHDIEVNQ